MDSAVKSMKKEELSSAFFGGPSVPAKIPKKTRKNVDADQKQDRSANARKPEITRVVLSDVEWESGNSFGGMTTPNVLAGLRGQKTDTPSYVLDDAHGAAPRAVVQQRKPAMVVVDDAFLDFFGNASNAEGGFKKDNAAPEHSGEEKENVRGGSLGAKKTEKNKKEKKEKGKKKEADKEKKKNAEKQKEAGKKVEKEKKMEKEKENEKKNEKDKERKAGREKEKEVRKEVDKQKDVRKEKENKKETEKGNEKEKKKEKEKEKEEDKEKKKEERKKEKEQKAKRELEKEKHKEKEKVDMEKTKEDMKKKEIEKKEKKKQSNSEQQNSVSKEKMAPSASEEGGQFHFLFDLDPSSAPQSRKTLTPRKPSLGKTSAQTKTELKMPAAPEPSGAVAKNTHKNRQDGSTLADTSGNIDAGVPVVAKEVEEEQSCLNEEADNWDEGELKSAEDQRSAAKDERKQDVTNRELSRTSKGDPTFLRLLDQLDSLLHKFQRDLVDIKLDGTLPSCDASTSPYTLLEVARKTRISPSLAEMEGRDLDLCAGPPSVSLPTSTPVRYNDCAECRESMLACTSVNYASPRCRRGIASATSRVRVAEDLLSDMESRIWGTCHDCHRRRFPSLHAHPIKLEYSLQASILVPGIGHHHDQSADSSGPALWAELCLSYPLPLYAAFAKSTPRRYRSALHVLCAVLVLDGMRDRVRTTASDTELYPLLKAGGQDWNDVAVLRADWVSFMPKALDFVYELVATQHPLWVKVLMSSGTREIVVQEGQCPVVDSRFVAEALERKRTTKMARRM